MISHVMDDGEEQPIAFASRTITKSERNYSQIEKEALAIIFGVRKFHNFFFNLNYLNNTYNTKQLQVLLTIIQYTSPTLQTI